MKRHMPTHRHPARNLALAALLLATLTPLQAQSTHGEVRQIDLKQGKLTLRHGEIKNLNMAPMTMVFRVADPALLQGLKVGSKLLFDAEDRQGQLVITALTPQP